MKRDFMTTLIFAVLVVAQNINGQINTNDDNAKLEADWSAGRPRLH